MEGMKVYKEGDTYRVGYVSTTDGKFKSTSLPSKIAEEALSGNTQSLKQWRGDYTAKKAADVLLKMKNDTKYGGKSRVRRHKKSKKHGHKKSKKHSRRQKSRRHN